MSGFGGHVTDPVLYLTQLSLVIDLSERLGDHGGHPFLSGACVGVARGYLMHLHAPATRCFLLGGHDADRGV